MIQLINPFNQLPLIKKADAWLDQEGNSFPVIGGVTRIVNEANYTDNFGFQ
jgi:hypothetical protein